MKDFPLLAVNLGEFYQEDMGWVLPLISALKIRYVELPLPMILERGVEKTKELLKSFHLGVSAINTWTKLIGEDDFGKERLDKSIEIARTLQTGIVVVYFGGGEDKIPCFRTRITPYLSENDITFVLENEFSSDATKDAEGCKRILEEIASPRLRLNYDPANFYIAGEEPFPYSFELLKDFIGYIHLKDVRKIGRIKKPCGKGDFYEEAGRKIWIGGKEKDIGYLAVPLGEGAINYEGFLGSLKEARYEGFITLELHTEKERQGETLRKSVEYIRRHLL